MKLFDVWRMDGHGALSHVIAEVLAANSLNALIMAIDVYGEEDIAVTDKRRILSKRRVESVDCDHYRRMNTGRRKDD